MSIPKKFRPQTDSNDNLIVMVLVNDIFIGLEMLGVKKYKHNAGFWAIDEFAQRKNFFSPAKTNMFFQYMNQNKFYWSNLQQA